MTSSQSKGDRRERELINILTQEKLGNVPKKYHGIFDEGDWAVMRAPSSGSATERELPDVLAGNGDAFYAFEAKSSKRGSAIYLDSEEVEALDYFALNFGARPRIAVRYDRKPWRFFESKDLHRTPNGNVRVKEADLDAGDALTDL